MSKEKRLFVISNSTHYLNVRNYISTHAEGDNYVIFLCKYSQGYKSIIDHLKANDALELLEVVYYNQKRGFPFSYIQILSFFTRVKKFKVTNLYFDKVFFCNYRSWMQHYIIKQFKRKETVLISDGTGIFQAVDFRKVDRESYHFAKTNFLIDTVMGGNPIKNLHFYSPVQIEVPEFDSLEIFKFPTSESSLVDQDKIYFVGGPLVELGIMKVETHISYLQEIKNKYSDKELFYFAHRAEEEKNLKQYDFFGRIMQDTIPFEERMEKEVKLPATVISYVSSVLINLPQLYPQVKFYYFPLQREGILKEERFKKLKILEENFRNLKRFNLQRFRVEK